VGLERVNLLSSVRSSLNLIRELADANNIIPATTARKLNQLFALMLLLSD
jgi:hypothetical protein